MKILVLAFVISAFLPLYAQQTFIPDEDGYISDTLFHKLIKEREYSLVGDFKQFEGYELPFAYVFNNYSWGLINSRGEEIIKPSYADIGSFSGGYAIVYLNGKQGLVSLKGAETIKPVYDQIYDHYDGPSSKIKTYAAIKGNEKWVIDAEGTILRPYEIRIYSNVPIASFKEKTEELYFNKYATIFTESGGKSGLKDYKGDIVLPPVYDSIITVKEGMIFKTKAAGESAWTLVDNAGEPISLMSYDAAFYTYRQAIKVSKKGKWGVLSLSGEVIVPVKYDDISMYCTERFFPVKKGDKWAIANHKGKEITKFIYDEIDALSLPYFVMVKQDGKYGALDTPGMRMIIPVEYDALKKSNQGSWGGLHNSSYNCIFISLNKKYGAINSEGKMIAPLIYDEIEMVTETRIGVRILDKFGMLDTSGKEVVPLKYDLMPEFLINVSKVKIGNNWGLIDEDGKILLSISYPPFSLTYQHEKGLRRVKPKGEREILVDRY